MSEPRLDPERTQELSPAAKFVLHVLRSEGEPLTITDLQHITALPKRTVEDALAQLREGGFVTSSTRLDDARRTRYTARSG